MLEPSRSQVWLTDLGEPIGREQGLKRPAVILSVDTFNHGPADLVIVLPITSVSKGIPFHVAVNPPEGGLKKRSFIKCEDISSISKQRLIKCWGRVGPATMAQVEDRIRILNGL